MTNVTERFRDRFGVVRAARLSAAVSVGRVLWWLRCPAWIFEWIFAAIYGQFNAESRYRPTAKEIAELVGVVVGLALAYLLLRRVS